MTIIRDHPKREKKWSRFCRVGGDGRDRERGEKEKEKKRKRKERETYKY